MSTSTWLQKNRSWCRGKALCMPAVLRLTKPKFPSKQYKLLFATLCTMQQTYITHKKCVFSIINSRNLSWWISESNKPLHMLDKLPLNQFLIYSNPHLSPAYAAIDKHDVCMLQTLLATVSLKVFSPSKTVKTIGT